MTGKAATIAGPRTEAADDELLTAREARVMLKVSPDGMQRLIDNRHVNGIPCHRLGETGNWRFWRSEIREWMARSAAPKPRRPRLMKKVRRRRVAK